ncbi:MAG: hypothetical protein IKU37_05960 [Candidatus Gastranaerophilales bacterium]|nr:hypothetical protein [Candidatus Gastranaerophilales bacterium]
MSKNFTLILICFMFSNVVFAENIYNSRGQKIGKYYTKGNKTTYYNKAGQRTYYAVKKSNRLYIYNNQGSLQYKATVK